MLFAEYMRRLGKGFTFTHTISSITENGNEYILRATPNQPKGYFEIAITEDKIKIGQLQDAAKERRTAYGRQKNLVASLEHSLKLTIDNARARILAADKTLTPSELDEMVEARQDVQNARAALAAEQPLLEKLQGDMDAAEGNSKDLETSIVALNIDELNIEGTVL